MVLPQTKDATDRLVVILCMYNYHLALDQSDAVDHFSKTIRIVIISHLEQLLKNLANTLLLSERILVGWYFIDKRVLLHVFLYIIDQIRPTLRQTHPLHPQFTFALFNCPS